MKKSRSRRIIGFILCIALLCTVVLSFVQYSHRTQDKIDQYAITNLNEIVALQKKTVQSNLSGDMQLLNNVTSLLTEGNANFEEAVDAIQNSGLDHGFYQLILFDANGNSATEDKSQVRVDFDDVKQQFNTKQSTYYNSKYSVINGELILIMSSPVLNKSNEVEYILVGVHTLDKVQTYIENTFDENGNIGILSNKGELIFSNQLTQLDVDLRKNYIKNFFSAVNTTFTADELFADLANNASGVFTYEYDGDEIFFQYTPLGINDWYIVVHVKKNSFVSHANLTATDSLVFLSILVLCAFILAVYIYFVNNSVKKELYNIAFYDKLTKIPNEEHFKIELDNILSRNKGEEFFCIVFDICNFKLINDRFGANTGDKVLCKISDILRTTVESFPEGKSTLAKMHSDTFVVLLPASATGENEVKMLALVREVRSATDFIGDYKMDISIGRTTTQIEDTATAVLERAIAAHSHAKRVAPNQFVDYNRLFISNLHTRAGILNSLDDAIKNGEFQIYLQPQFCTQTSKIHGAEILVRWIKNGEIRYRPDVFIPVLEETGRVSKLDSYLREQLCIKMRKWLDANIKLPHFSVNVSRIELLQSKFVPNLQSLLAKYDIPTSMIHIEVTETAYTEDQEKLVAKIIELKSAGFVVEMDDFGSGYSSLNVLKDIPVDIVKLDVKFIEKSKDKSRSGNILSSVVNMAKSINLTTVAEGVETREQAEYLVSIGCNYLQGYLLAKPMPTDDFIALLEKNQASAEWTYLDSSLKNPLI